MRHVLARDTNTNTVVILCDFEPSDFLVPVDVMPAPAKVAEFYGARAEELARVVFAAVGVQQKDEPKVDIPTLAGWPPPAESTAPTGDAVAEAVESA